jgi:molybdopterin converting factor small subunit
MDITVQFFGVLSEVAGTSFKHYQKVKSIKVLIMRIEDDFPEIVHENYDLAVNGVITNKNHVLKQGDEIALMPPVKKQSNHSK